jgi:hypothetical protein
MYYFAIPEDLRGATSLPWPCWSCQSCALDRFSFPRAVETLRPPPPAQRQSPCYAPSCGEIRAEAVRLPRRKSRDTCPRCPSPRPCSSRGPTSPGPMPSLPPPCTSRILPRSKAGIDRKHCSRPANRKVLTTRPTPGAFSLPGSGLTVTEEAPTPLRRGRV